MVLARLLLDHVLPVLVLDSSDAIMVEIWRVSFSAKDVGW